MRLLWAVQRYGAEVLGGSEVATREFAHRMVEKGHQVTVLTSCAVSYSDWANVYEPGESQLDGVRIIRLPVNSPRIDREFGPVHAQILGQHQPMLWQQQRWSRLIGPDLDHYTRWMRDHARDFDVAIFKAYLYSMATRGIPAAYGQVPILFNPEAHPEEMLNISLHEGIFRLADAFQFHSPEEAELVCRRFGFIPPHEVVGIGVAEEQFTDGATDVLAKLGLIESNYAVVVGRIDPGKGSYEAIAHFQRFVGETQSDLKLVFVGERGGLTEFHPQIIPTGFVTEEEKRDLIRGSLCLIQPSYLESFSIVLTEAWALGRPVLVQERSDVLRGQVFRSSGGACFRGYHDFANALARFQTDHEFANALGLSGRQFVQAEYSWPKVISRFENALDITIASFRSRHLLKDSLDSSENNS